MNSQEGLSVNIFPNPVSEELFIQMSSTDTEAIDMRLLSNLDQREYKYEVVDGRNEYLVRWNIPEAKAGIYTLVIHHRGNTTSKRIVVIR